MKYVDLSMPLNPRTPVYPGDPEVKIQQITSVGEDGYLDHLITIGTHNGTHIDAPAHMIDGGSMLSDFSLDTFVGKGKLVDVRGGFTIAAVEKAVVETGDIVIFWTGANYGDPEYYEKSAVITDEVAEYLVKKHVKMVGIDTGSVDAPPFKVHKTLLGNGILLAENLVNVALLENTAFTIYALPLNVDVEASPARVIAAL